MIVFLVNELLESPGFPLTELVKSSPFVFHIYRGGEVSATFVTATDFKSSVSDLGMRFLFSPLLNLFNLCLHIQPK